MENIIPKKQKKKMSEKAKNRDHSYMNNYMWITNGKNNKKILKNSEIPEGYWNGRTFSQKTLEKIKNLMGKIHQRQKERRQKELEKYKHNEIEEKNEDDYYLQ